MIFMKKSISVIWVCTLLLLTACSDNPSPSSEAQASTISGSEKETQAKDITAALLAEGLLSNSWDEPPFEDDYITFYCALIGDYPEEIPASEFESTLQSYFGLDADALRTNDTYDAEKNVYLVSNDIRAYADYPYHDYLRIDTITDDGDRMTIPYRVLWGDMAESGDGSDTAYAGEVRLVRNGDGYAVDSVMVTEDNSDKYDLDSSGNPPSLVDEAAVKTQFKLVLDACNDIISTFVDRAGPNENAMPTFEEYEQMSNAIGVLGYPVDYYQLDMPNHEKVEAFWKDVQAGKDAQITIYRLYNWALTADILVCKDGEVFLNSNVYSEYTDSGEITYLDMFEKVADMRMTEKGYLLYRIPAYDDFDDRFCGYRVTPLGEEKREYWHKYVEGLGYYPNGILRYDWSASNFSELKLNWTYEILYYKFNDKFPNAVYNKNDAEGRVLVPKDEMEAFMLRHLPFTVEQLRTDIPYIEAANAYAYTPFEGGGYAPVPEIVDIQTNGDSSYNLTIDAVAIEFGSDKEMTNILTVMDNTDGSVKYLSNVVIAPFEE